MEILTSITAQRRSVRLIIACTIRGSVETMILFRITQILDDLFGVPAERVDISDNLVEDWGLDDTELDAFDAEFCAEFNIRSVPEGTETLDEYVRLVNES